MNATKSPVSREAVTSKDFHPAIHTKQFPSNHGLSLQNKTFDMHSHTTIEQQPTTSDLAHSSARSRKVARRMFRNGFSIVELLIVIAIMVILASVGASTLSGKSGSEVTQAGNTVYDLAGLARQNALAKNTRTILVLAQISDAGTPRSAVSIWDAATTNQLEKWNLLPTAVIATNASADYSVAAFQCRYRSSIVTNANFYEFYPDGRMVDDMTKKPRISVSPRSVNSPNRYTIEFNPLTGRGKIIRP